MLCDIISSGMVIKEYLPNDGYFFFGKRFRSHLCEQREPLIIPNRVEDVQMKEASSAWSLGQWVLNHPSQMSLPEVRCWSRSVVREHRMSPGLALRSRVDLPAEKRPGSLVYGCYAKQQFQFHTPCILSHKPTWCIHHLLLPPPPSSSSS